MKSSWQQEPEVNRSQNTDNAFLPPATQTIYKTDQVHFTNLSCLVWQEKNKKKKLKFKICDSTENDPTIKSFLSLANTFFFFNYFQDIFHSIILSYPEFLHFSDAKT